MRCRYKSSPRRWAVEEDKSCERLGRDVRVHEKNAYRHVGESGQHGAKSLAQPPSVRYKNYGQQYTSPYTKSSEERG